MKLDNLSRIEELEQFLEGNQPIAFAVFSSKQSRYQAISSILNRFGYQHLKGGDKGVVIQFLLKISSYSVE